MTDGLNKNADGTLTITPCWTAPCLTHLERALRSWPLFQVEPYGEIKILDAETIKG